jgi:hypothetical protein
VCVHALLPKKAAGSRRLCISTYLFTWESNRRWIF